jgi:hypothetical protein
MTRWVKAGVVGLAFLTACGGLAGRTKDGDVPEWLRTLHEAQQKGEVGSVEGYLYLILPGPPIPLRDWPVTLIPLPPTLEASVSLARGQFARTGRIPLTADALRLAYQPITDYIKELTATGHKDLIRTVKTVKETDPKFTFQDVPQGRWLLLAQLPSKISVLLWVVPVTVTKGEVTWQSLNDKNLWLEGLTP